jgi:Tfp pilus assembly protein PilF
LDDIFKIQDEITAKIIEAMKVQLGTGDIASATDELTDNAEAYQLYLQGRHFWRQRSAESLHRAVDLFTRAIELDPNFHRAWSNLAVAYKNMPSYDFTVSRAKYVELSVKAAEQALQINPDSSEALTVLADNYAYNCNSLDAAKSYENAIKANPDDPTSHHWYAIFLMERGHIEAALREIKTARQIDPLISAVISVESIGLAVQGNYQRAATLARQSSELGIYEGSHYYIGLFEALQGNHKRARALMEAGLIDVDDIQLTGIQLFLDALEDPEKSDAFESFVSGLDVIPPSNVYLFAEMLTYLGSSTYFDVYEGAGCLEINESIWADQFRAQRGTPRFFNYMEKFGVVDYWRKYGWPDDCASLDQTLAECD